MEKTPLNEIHKNLGAKMVDFHGWEMPLQYSSIIKEHKNVRSKCGIFDISHMGEIIIEGEKAFSNVQNLITNNISKLKDGKALYTPMCLNDGGIIDDILVYRLDRKRYLLVVNAANIEKDYKWIKENIEGNGCKVSNVSSRYSLVAVQGPNAITILDNIFPLELNSLYNFHFRKTKFEGEDILVSRTGYTGELGFEIFSPPEKISKIWTIIMEKGKKFDLVPVGLGARNTLRLEKKYCLYGNDITEENHPLEAGLEWAVDFNKKEFIGKNSLLKLKEKGFNKILTGFVMKERAIPRKDYIIEKNNKTIGKVTSGSYSPSMEKNIGLGYIEKKYSSPGMNIYINIRNKKYEAKVVETPFI